jgi:hypothetical protein
VATVNIETFGVPSWWAGATTIQINLMPTGTTQAYSRANLEILPQGISETSTGLLFPWANIRSVEKVT